MAGRPAQVPLAAHALFRSNDLDEARERVAAVFCPHRLEISGARTLFDARHHHLRGGRISLNYIEYGARTLIAPGELEQFYLVQIPLEGSAEIRNGAESYISTPDQAAVLNPHLPTRMTWEEGTRQVLIQIDRRAMQDHLAAELGAPSDRPLTFLGPVDLTTGPGAALRRLTLWLVAEADAGAPPIGAGLMARQIESTVMSGLLESARHDHASLIARQRSAPRPRHLRTAETYIEAHLDHQLTVEEVAAAAGISPRGLQLAFRQHRGTTPLGVLARCPLGAGARGIAPGRAGNHRHGRGAEMGFCPFRSVFRGLPGPLWPVAARHAARRRWVRRSHRQQFQRNALTDADTQRDEGGLAFAFGQTACRRAGDARAGHAKGMAHGNAATHRVHARIGVVQAPGAGAGQHLRRERPRSTR